MQFPAKFAPEKNGWYTVTFPDIPEAITCGNSLDDAMRMAEDALEVALDFYFEDRRPVPWPSPPKRGQRLVPLASSVAAKVLLHNELVEQHVRPAELAKRMGVTKQEVNRILDPRHATKIDTIANALRALGKTLELATR